MLLLQGEWKPKQIDNPNYKGEWVHPEIDNPEYTADDKLYKYDDIGAIGFDLWQVSDHSLVIYIYIVYLIACSLYLNINISVLDKCLIFH